MKHKLRFYYAKNKHRFPLELQFSCWFDDNLKHVTGIEFIGFCRHISIGITGGKCYDPSPASRT